MHDPMVVAWEVPFPLPRRVKWRDPRPGHKRWTLGRRRRTNEENLGEPVYRWYRPAGWELRLAGRAFGMRSGATIWHVEPHERDSGEVCKHSRRWQDEDGRWHSKPLRAWRWHVHHWRIQIPALQSARARLFDRCAMCGRKGRPNISFQWDGKRLGWWKFRSREGLYHRECSELGNRRQNAETDGEIIRYLMGALAVTAGKDEATVLAGLTDPRNGELEFRLSYRLTHMLGYERGENYELVPARPTQRTTGRNG